MKQKLLKTMLLLCALVVGSGSAWAADPTVTFSYADYKGEGTSSTGSEYTMEKTQVSITESKFYCASSGSYAQFYAGGTITITPGSGITVKQIDLTASSSSYNGYQSSGTITASTGSMSHDGTTVTWEGSATAAFTLSHTKQIRWTSIVVTYVEATPSITAADVDIAADVLAGNISYSISNPDGSTLTAAKKSGDWLTVGAVDAVNKKVAFTATENTGDERTAVVTLTYGSVTKDVTITQAAAATKYAVTYDGSPSNGTLVIKRGETTVSSGDEVSDGTVLTIEATPSDAHDYALSKWEYKEDGGSWTDGVGTSYTIDGKDVEFRATFVARIYHNITYSVNGATTVVEVEEGDDVSFAAPASGIPTGYTFKGWVVAANKIDIPTDTDPKANYVTSATSTADITYYAVMAVESAVPQTETLTQSEITTNLTNTTCAYGTEKSYTDGDIKWTISAYTDNASRPWMQLKKANNSYIKITAPTGGKITGLTFTITSASNSSGGITDITKHTDYSGYIYVDTSAKSTPTGGLGSTSTVSSDQMSLSVTGNNNVVYMQVGTGARVWGIEVTYNTTSTSHYCTTVSDVPVTVSSAGYATFVSSLPIDFTDSDIEAYIATSASGSAVTLSAVNKVPANTGILLKYSGGTTENIPVFDGTGADAVTGNKLKVSDGSVTGGEGIYALANKTHGVGFYLVSDKLTIASGKVYLDLSGSPVKEFLDFDFGGDNETAIESLTPALSEGKGYVYDLSGRRVQKPTKGLYIVNGKKIMF